MSFRRPGRQFNTPEHLRNYEAFMRRQVNATETLGIYRAGASARASEQFLRAERVFAELPDRVSRNLYKQLLRRSVKRLTMTYKTNWRTHSASFPSYGAQPSLRKAASAVIQGLADTRGLKTTAKSGFHYKRRPRSRVAPIVDAKPGWGIRKLTAAQFPKSVLQEDLATVIEQQFDDLVRKARLKARKS